MESGSFAIIIHSITKAMTPRLHWIKIKHVFQVYLYLLVFCTIFILITMVSFYNDDNERHLFLEEEIKSEVDLSSEADQDLSFSAKFHNSVNNGDQRRTNRNLQHVKGPRHTWDIRKEELQNSALFQRISNGFPFTEKVQRNTSGDNNIKGCIGKRVNLEFKFHEITKYLHIYSAFWDSRLNDFDNRNGGVHQYIRMMGLADMDNPHPPISCLFYIKGAYRIIPAEDYSMCESHNKKYQGHMYSCKVPKAVRSIVCSVLVAHGNLADPKWATRIPVSNTEPQETKFTFAQCIPPLFGKINERKLVEYIEMSRLMGSEHFTFYNMRAPQNIAKTLAYYEMKGMVDVIPWPLPGIYKNSDLWYHGQIVAIQDCLYRNMASAMYLAFLDLDEYLIPHKHRDWSELVTTFSTPNRTGFVFKSAFFDPNKSNVGRKETRHLDHLTIAENTVRSSMISLFRNKCLIKPQSIFEQGIHHISKPINSALESYEFDPDVALIHHYRPCSATYGQNCEDFVIDKSAIRFAGKLRARVEFALDWIDKIQ